MTIRPATDEEKKAFTCKYSSEKSPCDPVEFTVMDEETFTYHLCHADGAARYTRWKVHNRA